MTVEAREVVAVVFNRVCKMLNVGRSGIRLDEMDLAHSFWDSLCDDIECETPDSILLVSLEEALVLRILSYRLLRELETVDESEKAKSVEQVRNVRKPNEVGDSEKGKQSVEAENVYKVDFKGGVKAWLKTNERLRFVMKDILKQYGHTRNTNTVSLAEIMAPILELGEGVLEDALEFETRKKSTQKTKPETRSASGMDAPA